MGKIRIKTLGDQKQEKKDNKKAQAKAEAKKAAEAAKRAAGELESEADEPKETKAEAEVVEEKAEKKTEGPEQSRRTKKDKFKKSNKSSRSKSYLAVAEKVDKNKLYKLADALTLLPDLKISKFDETVELHLNTTEQGISGAVTLPHGTGKSVKVEIINATADPKHADDVIKKVEGGQIDFASLYHQVWL